MTTPPLIIVPVVLSGPTGSKVIRMVLDSGANGTLIPTDIVLAIGCKIDDSKKRVPLISATNMHYVPLVRIPQLRSLGVTVQDFEVLCHQLPDESVAEGLLGLDFLRHVPAFQEFEKKIRALT